MGSLSGRGQGSCWKCMGSWGGRVAGSKRVAGGGRVVVGSEWLAGLGGGSVSSWK